MNVLAWWHDRLHPIEPESGLMDVLLADGRVDRHQHSSIHVPTVVRQLPEFQPLQMLKTRDADLGAVEEKAL